MTYVGRDGGDGDACVFCDRLAADDDMDSLILLRLDRVIVIMNLYPYATGHLMVIPHHHGASIEDAPPEILAAMAAALPLITRAARRALGCAGFNVGMNAGAVAGAGIADHLHLHVVPRWPGDANFMPVIAQTAVLPESLPATYAKLRHEIARELRQTGYGRADGADARTRGSDAQTGVLTGATLPPDRDGPQGHLVPDVPGTRDGATEPAGVESHDGTPTGDGVIPLMVLSPDGTHLWLDRDASGPRLPIARPTPGEAIWRAAARTVAPVGRAAVLGLAGPPDALSRATPDAGPLALALRLEHHPIALRDRFVPLAEARRLLPALALWPAFGRDQDPTA